MQLREYQESAINATIDAYKRGSKGVFLVLPTGAGKTVIFSNMLKRVLNKGKRALVLAHRKELVDQAVDKLSKVGIDAGVIMAGHNPRYWQNIQVASIQTAIRRTLPFTPDVIVIDEAHRIRGKSYSDFVKRYPNALLLLVSATAFRLDGKGFTEFADTLIVGSTIKDLIADPSGPFLVPPVTYLGKVKPNLSGVGTQAGDFKTAELGQAMSDRAIIGDIVQEYKKHSMYRKGVCFCADIAHSLRVCEEFNQAGIPCAHIDGTTPREQREAVLKDLHTGKIMMVTNANVLTEGWDEPSIGCVILARPTMSKGLYIQMAGRGLRLHGVTMDESKGNGKIDCNIHDHGENVLRHGLVTDPHVQTLEGRKKKKRKTQEEKDAEEQVKKEEAQANSIVIGRELDELEGQLERIDESPHDLKHFVVKYYNLKRQQANYKTKADGRKYHKDWAWYKSVEKFGEAACAQFLPPEALPWSLKKRVQHATRGQGTPLIINNAVPY